MKPKSQDLNAFLSSSDHRGKVLIEDDGKNGRGEGRVGKIIHGPAEDLSLFDRHDFLEDQIGRWGDEELGRNNNKDFTPSPYYPISSSLIFFNSDGSDFLPHKDEVTDSETEKGDGHNRNQMWQDNIDALGKRQRILKTSQRKSF